MKREVRRSSKKKKSCNRGVVVILFLIHLLFFGGFSTLMALDPQKAITQYKLDIWQVERGFPQNSVFAIVQTHEGYIWLGTLDGFVRFDGIRFKVFNKDNTKQLKSNVINALCGDRNGRLWIGMDSGLSCQKDGEFTTYPLGEERHLHFISSIVQDKKGTLWIGSRESGITSLRKGS